MFFPPWNSQRKTHPKLPNSGCVVPHTKGGEQPGRRRTQSRIPVKHQPSLFCRLLVWRLQVVNPENYHPSHVERISQEVTGSLQQTTPFKSRIANHPFKRDRFISKKTLKYGVCHQFLVGHLPVNFDHKLKIWSHLGSMERPLRSRRSFQPNWKRLFASLKLPK